MKFYLFIIVLFTTLSATGADIKSQADSLYLKQNYAQAIALYDSLLKAEGRSAEVLYNLGNAYYKRDDIAHAIINYERALQLAPGDDDIRFNLALARAKTIDKITPSHEIFFITWWHSLVYSSSSRAWAFCAIVSFVVCMLFALLFLFASRIWLQKTGFYLAVVSFLICLLSNVCAWNQLYNMTHRHGAVVISPSAVVRSTPSESGTELFVLHEGTRVDVTDDTMSSWKEVVLADKKRGWISSSALVRI